MKAQIRQFHCSIDLDRQRRDAGTLPSLAGGGGSGGEGYHMVFQGNPGTGKTKLARIMAELLQRIGVTRSATLVEVQREQLVAEHIGQTAPKTAGKIAEASNGVLFVDEAYRLSDTGSLAA